MVLDLRHLLYCMVPHTWYVVEESFLLKFLTRFIIFYHCELKVVIVMTNSLGTSFVRVSEKSHNPFLEQKSCLKSEKHKCSKYPPCLEVLVFTVALMFNTTSWRVSSTMLHPHSWLLCLKPCNVCWFCVYIYIYIHTHTHTHTHGLFQNPRKIEISVVLDAEI